MDPFRSMTAVAVPLLRANVDTDAIIPSREMKSVSKTGLADGLFAGWRYMAIGGREPNREFVLNHPAYIGARILLGGENFGCGSSREHAVWALREYGFRVIIAPSFAPIFYGNCVRNGIVPVTLDVGSIARLADHIAASPAERPLTVDLETCCVSAGGLRFGFSMDDEPREILLEGLDPIALTLKAQKDIERFLARDRAERPWIYLERSRS